MIRNNSLKFNKASASLNRVLTLGNKKNVINNPIWHSILLLILLVSCTQSNNIEHDVFQNNFNTFLDSTLDDRRKLVVASVEVVNDSINQANLKNGIQGKRNIQLPPLVVVIMDSIIPISDLDSFLKKVKQSKFEYELIVEDELIVDGVYKIDITNLEIDNSKYELITYSDFDKNKDISGEIVRTDNLPICSFSNIYFNKEQNLGAFKMSIVYSGLDGYGLIVFIKKESGNWVVDKIMQDWIA